MNLSIRRMLALTLLLCGVAGLSGCGTDMLTWAKDSKREGLKDMKDAKYSDAVGAFRNSIRQDPSDPECYWLLGQSYEQLNDTHEAIDQYKTGIRMMPKPNTYRYDAALKEKMIDRLAHCIADTDASHVETDLLQQQAAASKSPEDYRMLGRVFRYRGDADSAIDQYRHAITLDPDDFSIHKEFGLYLEQLNLNQQAGEVLRAAYRLNQNDPEVNDGLRKIGIVPGPALL